MRDERGFQSLGEVGAVGIDAHMLVADTARVLDQAWQTGIQRRLATDELHVFTAQCGRFVERKPNPPVNQALSSWKALTTPQPVERRPENMPAGV